MELTNFLIGIVEGGHKLRIAYAKTPFLLKNYECGNKFSTGHKSKIMARAKKIRTSGKRG